MEPTRGTWQTPCWIPNLRLREFVGIRKEVMKIEEKVLSIVRDNTEDKKAVTLSSDLRKELCLDSFGTLMLINAVEEAFGISVDEKDFCRVNTVSDVVGLLAGKYQCT